MRFAYADPPYIGQARKHYGPLASEVDHLALVGELMGYDGWALSCRSPTLFRVGNHICHVAGPDIWDECRVGSWVKPFASFKVNVNPAYAWEPVIFWGGRPQGRDVLTVRDWVSAPITLRRGVHGAKPAKFCVWVFQMLGMERDDEFVDLFPGSGAVSRAWEQYRAQGRVFA